MNVRVTYEKKDFPSVDAVELDYPISDVEDFSLSSSIGGIAATAKRTIIHYLYRWNDEVKITIKRIEIEL